MERSTSAKWLNDFKIALIQNNHKEMYILVMNIPSEFDNFEQMKEAGNMVETAIEIFRQEKNEAKKYMHNIKKMKEFLVQNKKSKFDKSM